MPSLRPLLPLTAVLLGAAAGLGAFTFGYAKGYSYLTNDPAACANCHLMD
ncbi:MAG TPA: cytochrome c nitrite reductase small subunit, partial [Thermoanaerobaculia bacterium]|nr:cytochrome c nitrite reductase small subunit [Thermoanaerobaculia bacterium]